jgi:regulator of protease activity HflC (stomatin/prohibitin superfamily)
VEAERKKRANILDSEGTSLSLSSIFTVSPSSLIPLSLGDRASAINRAEGHRQSTILASEAVQMEQINQAKGTLLTLMQKISLGPNFVGQNQV